MNQNLVPKGFQDAWWKVVLIPLCLVTRTNLAKGLHDVDLLPNKCVSEFSYGMVLKM